jgi:hypothetical protein
MAKILNAENAKIITATVTLRALTIERRQVTLSVFRQLIEEPIVDKDVLRLSGVGWGHVRYLIDQPPDRAIHLVWQKGNELRRCIVERYQNRWTQAYTNQFNADIIFKYAIDNQGRQESRKAFFCHDWWEWKRKPLGRYYDPPSDDPDISPPRYPACDRKTPEYLAYEVKQNEYNAAYKARGERLVAHQNAAMEDYRLQVTELLQEEYDERCAWCDQYEALVAPLFDLPQLFIAA